MPSLNKAILIGNLCAVPELKQTNSGVSVTQFSIGISRKFKNKDGGNDSDFVTIVAWRQTAEFICRYFTKGNAICICGSIQSRSYTDREGNKRTAVEVVADEVNFVEKRDNTFTPPEQPQSAPRQAAPTQSAPPTMEELADDDDLPF